MPDAEAPESGGARRSEGRIWTLDVGNSRAKLRRWRWSGERKAWRLELADAGQDEWPLNAAPLALARALDSEADLDGVWAALSCVASPQLEQSLADAFTQRLGGRFLGAPDSGLANRCAPALGVGRDRLFAARGAFEVLGRSAHVVDVGSAVTVDALVVPDGPPAAARAEFRGGAIAPGPALLAAALGTRTARLPALDVRPGAAAVGRDTQAAISAGVFHGLRGAVRELVERAGDALSLGRLPVVLTGGAAPWLLEPPLFPEREVVHEPELVHIGLLHAAAERVAARTGGSRGSAGGR